MTSHSEIYAAVARMIELFEQKGIDPVDLWRLKGLNRALYGARFESNDDKK